MPTPDDIWYALANTKVLLAPRRRLATFGDTVICYHLISEKMDAVNEVRIREGRLHAEKPQVLTPAYFQSLLLDGFGEKGEHYAEWLKDHLSDLAFLKYGFRFRKEEFSESTLHENLDSVADRVTQRVEAQGDPLTTVIRGVDDAWEVCLLKFMTDLIRESVPENVMHLKKRRLLESVAGIPRAVREEIEGDFDAAGADRDRMKTLGAKLRHYGVFEAYEDRFFDLVRRISA